jgi:hypothetical protein
MSNAKGTTFIATAPDGTEITRTSLTRTYTHAVLVESTQNGLHWGLISFNSREDLAVKEAKKWPVGVEYSDGSTFLQVIVVPVRIAE